MLLLQECLWNTGSVHVHVYVCIIIASREAKVFKTWSHVCLWSSGRALVCASSWVWAPGLCCVLLNFTWGRAAAQWSRTSVVLSEDLSQVLATRSGGSQLLVTPAPRRPDASIWHPHACAHTPHRLIIKNKLRRKHIYPHIKS